MACAHLSMKQVKLCKARHNIMHKKDIILGQNLLLSQTNL